MSKSFLTQVRLGGN